MGMNMTEKILAKHAGLELVVILVGHGDDVVAQALPRQPRTEHVEVVVVLVGQFVFVLAPDRDHAVEGLHFPDGLILGLAVLLVAVRDPHLAGHEDLVPALDVLVHERGCLAERLERQQVLLVVLLVLRLVGPADGERPIHEVVALVLVLLELVAELVRARDAAHQVQGISGIAHALSSLDSARFCLFPAKPKNFSPKICKSAFP